jgi:uncharacterized RDD family membrane protein YckC
MTCQACQTWNLDDDHRCRRCGRRLRTTPTRLPRDSYPIAATALAYRHEEFVQPQQQEQPVAITAEAEPQQVLFANPPEPRVIPFDQFASPAERESIRARAALIPRLSPVKTGKVEVSPRRSRRARNQQELDFLGKADVIATPQSTIECAAPVAPPALRLTAAMIDGLMIVLGSAVFLGVFRFATGTLPLDRQALIAYAAGVFCISLSYKLAWCFANQDSFGMAAARLRLIDLDGNLPSPRRRLWRAASSFLSVGAAGLGLIWTFADPDGLAWHDQISGTFPTFIEE